MATTKKKTKPAQRANGATRGTKRAGTPAMEPTTVTAAQTEVPIEIVREAMRDPFLKGRVFLCSKRREALVCDGQVVGFVSPHQTPSGWRHGPIFVQPAYRNRGLVQTYYASHPERDCVAFVDDENTESRAAHEAAGFVQWKRAANGWFMRRPAAEKKG